MRAMFLALAVLLSAAQAETYPDTAKVTAIRIWPGVAPGSEQAPAQENFSRYGSEGHRRFWNISTPVLSAFYAAKPNGTAVMVIPGGGYGAVYVDASVEIAHWLNTLGIDAFVLKYRLPNEGHQHGFSVPLQDAQRALRLIRSGVLSEHAGHKVDPARVGVIGFSAGGNLAAVLGTYYDTKVYQPSDDADALSARPDFMILGYAMLPRAWEVDLAYERRQTDELLKTYEVGRMVSARTPPAFLFAGDADDQVRYTQSERLARDLENAGVPAEIHIFAGAGHGFGLHGKGPEGVWPDLCATWLRARGVIPQ
jgi:acetyl esterase/lipase